MEIARNSDRPSCAGPRTARRSRTRRRSRTAAGWRRSTRRRPQRSGRRLGALRAERGAVAVRASTCRSRQDQFANVPTGNPDSAESSRNVSPRRCRSASNARIWSPRSMALIVTVAWRGSRRACRDAYVGSPPRGESDGAARLERKRERFERRTSVPKSPTCEIVATRIVRLRE